MSEDYNVWKLPIQEKCQNKLWRVRESGYEEAAEFFKKRDVLLKMFVEDNNVVAQEKGLMAVLAFFENAACHQRVVGDIMSGLVKCFSSSREKTRDLAMEITLMCIKIDEKAVLDELTKGLENKSPKVVINCLVAFQSALKLFGLQVVAIKSLAKPLSKLLGNRDEGVREESKRLCVEIYRWIDAYLRIHKQSSKHPDLLELENDFRNIVNETPALKGYLKSQPEKTSESKEKFFKVHSMPPVDALNLLITHNFYEQCEAKNWKQRKEALEILLQLTADVKLKPDDDYTNIIITLEKLVSKDSNVAVVSLAVKCLRNIIQELRNGFMPYASTIIPTAFEKLKEKNWKVVEPLRETIDALFRACGFEVMLRDIQSALLHKNPQIKSETSGFLYRAFSICVATEIRQFVPSSLITSLLKALNDTNGFVRENAAKALGVALKLIDERDMSYFLHEVDPIKMAMILHFFKVMYPATAERKFNFVKIARPPIRFSIQHMKREKSVLVRQLILSMLCKHHQE